MAKSTPAQLVAEAFEKAFELFATKDDLKNFATKDDLKNFATKDDLKNFATKDDLKRFATKEDLSKLDDKLTTKMDQILQALQNQQGQIQVLTQIITGQVKRAGGNGD